MKHLFTLFLLIISISSCQTPLDKRIEKEARDYTEKHCPKWIDACTLLDSTTYDIPSRTYTYWYTVSGDADNDAFFSDLQADTILARQRYAEALRNDPNLKQTLEAEINIRYHYRSQSNGLLRFTITVTPDDYK